MRSSALLEYAPPALSRTAGSAPAAVTRSVRLHPFERWWAALAAALVPVSLIWDFSWEASIGADRFWSPPHLVLHCGIWLSGGLAGWLVFKFTSARQQGHLSSAIELGPLCAPAGAWVLLWSAATLQLAFLLDAWWQRAYGLSVGLWPPPQILKAIGFFGILLGALALATTARMNGSPGGPSRLREPEIAISWHGGLVVTMCALVLTMTNYPNLQHTGSFYRASCAVYPAALLACGGASRHRWGTAMIAFHYMVLVASLVWLVPLFPAQPLTPPVYNPITHLMPPTFPLLLLAPAWAMDWVRRRPLFARQSPAEGPAGSHLRCALRAAACGLAFVAVFVPTQWFFSKFLLSPQADGWFFAGGGQHWPYFLKIDQARTLFWETRNDPFNWPTPLGTVLLATGSAWLGLQAGHWFNRLRR